MPKDFEDSINKEGVERYLKNRTFSKRIHGWLLDIVFVVMIVATPFEELFWPIMGFLGVIVLFFLINRIRKEVIIRTLLFLGLWLAILVSLFVEVPLGLIFWVTLIFIDLQVLWALLSFGNKHKEKWTTKETLLFLGLWLAILVSLFIVAPLGLIFWVILILFSFWTLMPPLIILIALTLRLVGVKTDTDDEVINAKFKDI